MTTTRHRDDDDDDDDNGPVGGASLGFNTKAAALFTRHPSGPLSTQALARTASRCQLRRYNYAVVVSSVSGGSGGGGERDLTASLYLTAPGQFGAARARANLRPVVARARAAALGVYASTVIARAALPRPASASPFTSTRIDHIVPLPVHCVSTPATSFLRARARSCKCVGGRAPERRKTHQPCRVPPRLPLSSYFPLHNRRHVVVRAASPSSLSSSLESLNASRSSAHLHAPVCTTVGRARHGSPRTLAPRRRRLPCIAGVQRECNPQRR